MEYLRMPAGIQVMMNKGGGTVVMVMTFFFLTLSIPVYAQETQPLDICTPAENGRYRLSGGAELSGSGFLLSCNGAQWVKVFSFETDGIFRPQLTNSASCVNGDTISYDAATGGLRCEPCPGVTAPGQPCPDGSIYAGLSPDGNVPMYMTTVDHEIISAFGGHAMTGNPVCSAAGTDEPCYTGAANTLALAALSVVQTIPRYCNDLIAHGRNDWYLPSKDEFAVLAHMHSTYGSDLSPNGEEWYFTSSETYHGNGSHIWTAHVFSGMGWFEGYKPNVYPARCVRK